MYYLHICHFGLGNSFVKMDKEALEIVICDTNVPLARLHVNVHIIRH